MVDSPAFTLAFAAAVGAILVAASNRLRIPSIALLLLAGVAVGPHGMALIDPNTLGKGLRLIVGLAVAIILFEGGLTLDMAGARRNGRFIWRVLTMGVLITWLGTAVAVFLLFELPVPVALLCGSLVIVTGPTVVSPLLRRIGVRDRIKDVLYWEAVLGDAVGVFIAVLCFEWQFSVSDHPDLDPLVRFAARAALGLGAGVSFGAAVTALLRWKLIPEDNVNIVVLGMALLCYGLCEALLHESGVLAVIIAGLVVGLQRPEQLTQLKRFKLELTELGIGTLFILLAARLDLEPFQVYGWKLFLAVAILLVVLRPVAIAIATWRLEFSIQEKLFLSWIAPRGIVAAFMASLFALEIARDAAMTPHGQLLQTFTFAVIGTTVILQGLSAPLVARVLGLKAPARNAWLVAGHPTVALAITTALRRAGAHAVGLAPLDHSDDRGSGAAESDAPSARHAAGDSHDAPGEALVLANPLDHELFVDPRLAHVGAVLAVSANPYFNQLICQHWADAIGASRCYRVADPAIDAGPGLANGPGLAIWSGTLQPVDLQRSLEAGTVAVDTMAASSGAGAASLVDQLGEQVKPLFVVSSKDHVAVYDASSSLARASQLVVVRPRIPNLAELIGDAIVVTDEAPSFELVIERLLERASRESEDLPIAELLHSIVDRERSMPTAMGAGVAIPHAYYPGVERSRCYAANVKNGMADEVGPDGKPICLVFLVLSPVGKAEEHLKSLAAIARLTSDDQYTRMIEREQSGERLLARILSRS